MFKHLLVPLDGSTFAEAALPAVIEIASRFQSEITLLQVLQAPYFFTGTDGPGYVELLAEIREQTHDEAMKYLETQRTRLRQYGFRVHIKVIELEPVAAAILDEVAQSHADTIVMSTHGRGGLSRWVFGSVADKVLRSAAVPVLLIRATAESAPNQS